METRSVIPLEKIQESDIAAVGGKAYGLTQLSLAGLEDAQPHKKRSILSDIRQVIIEGPISEELTERISNHYRRLKADYIAVRSSATAEDLPGHSFAGQYDTYLGITDLAGCVDTVKKCWASLWTQRAYDYRQKNGFDHLTVNMAVIVQELVKADASGVIFTIDPLNGYKP
ncbi:MAG: PEP/pyruvate-binding domain-containing protein [Planctomycetota bacterium]|jgi:pyruvate,water dikinase